MPLSSRMTVTSPARPGRVGLAGGRRAAESRTADTTTTVGDERRHHHDGQQSQKDTTGDDDSTHPARLGHRRTTTRGRAVRQTWTLPFADGGAATGFSLDDLTLALLVGSLVLVVSVAAVRLSLRSGLPSLLIYLGIGLVLGEAGFGIRYDDQQLTQVLGYAALVLILVEGGLTTQWSGIRRSVAPAAVLATVGVAVSVLVVAVAAHFCLGWSLAGRLPRRRRARLHRCRGRVLGAAPGAAPPPASPGCSRPSRASTTRPSCCSSPPSPPGWRPAPTPDPWWQVGVIADARARRGRPHRAGHRLARRPAAAAWSPRRRRPCSPSASSSVAVLAYAAADVVHTSGFIACYLAALVLGNLRTAAPPGRLGFATADRLARPDRPVRAARAARVARASFLDVLVAGPRRRRRPCSCSAARCRCMASCAAVRDAVAHPGVPVVGGAARRRARRARDGARHGRGPGRDWIFDLVFVLVVVFTVVQAPTLPWVARRLGRGHGPPPGRPRPWRPRR